MTPSLRRRNKHSVRLRLPREYATHPSFHALYDFASFLADDLERLYFLAVGSYLPLAARVRLEVALMMHTGESSTIPLTLITSVPARHRAVALDLCLALFTPRFHPTC